MHTFEPFVRSLAEWLPLETFVVLGSFLEEVIAPIPSPSIMVIAGSFGEVQGYTIGGLALLVLLASIGKTLGGITMYFIAAKLKDVALPAVGKFVGVTAADIDTFSARFTGKARDYAVYIFLRSVPIIPSILLSFGSGVIRLPLRLFIIGTFVGTVIRDTFYIIVGYKGTEVLGWYLARTSETESLVELLSIGVIGSGLIYLLIRQRRKKRLLAQSK
jgi:membrane protein DedA with SNARE-associated domain